MRFLQYNRLLLSGMWHGILPQLLWSCSQLVIIDCHIYCSKMHVVDRPSQMYGLAWCFVSGIPLQLWSANSALCSALVAGKISAPDQAISAMSAAACNSRQQRYSHLWIYSTAYCCFEVKPSSPLHRWCHFSCGHAGDWSS